MPIDYDSLANTALRLIADAGGVFQVIEPPAIIEDADSSWFGDDTAGISRDVTGVFIPLSDEVLIAAKGLTFELTAAFVLKNNEDVYKINKIDLVRPNGVDIVMYQLKVEQWPG